MTDIKKWREEFLEYVSRMNLTRDDYKGVVAYMDEALAIEPEPSAEPEIIRCKDCKFWTHIKRTKRHWCKTDDGLYDLNTSADDFCSRAERRTDEPDR